MTRHILAPNEILVLEPILEKRVFKNTIEIIYEGHIPHVGYLLIQGEAFLGKKNKFKQVIRPGTTIGARELLNGHPHPSTAKIFSGSEVYILCRSSLMELINNSSTNPVIQPILNKILHSELV